MKKLLFLISLFGLINSSITYSAEIFGISQNAENEGKESKEISEMPIDPQENRIETHINKFPKTYELVTRILEAKIRNIQKKQDAVFPEDLSRQIFSMVPQQSYSVYNMHTLKDKITGDEHTYINELCYTVKLINGDLLLFNGAEALDYLNFPTIRGNNNSSIKILRLNKKNEFEIINHLNNVLNFTLLNNGDFLCSCTGKKLIIRLDKRTNEWIQIQAIESTYSPKVLSDDEIVFYDLSNGRWINKIWKLNINNEWVHDPSTQIFNESFSLRTKLKNGDYIAWSTDNICHIVRFDNDESQFRIITNLLTNDITELSNGDLLVYTLNHYSEILQSIGDKWYLKQTIPHCVKPIKKLKNGDILFEYRDCIMRNANINRMFILSLNKKNNSWFESSIFDNYDYAIELSNEDLILFKCYNNYVDIELRRKLINDKLKTNEWVTLQNIMTAKLSATGIVEISNEYLVFLYTNGKIAILEKKLLASDPKPFIDTSLDEDKEPNYRKDSSVSLEESTPPELVISPLNQ